MNTQMHTGPAQGETESEARHNSTQTHRNTQLELNSDLVRRLVGIVQGSSLGATE